MVQKPLWVKPSGAAVDHQRRWLSAHELIEKMFQDCQFLRKRDVVLLTYRIRLPSSGTD